MNIEQWTTFADEFNNELLYPTTALYEDSPDKSESTDNSLYIACFFKLSSRVGEWVLRFTIFGFLLFSFINTQS